MWNLRQYHRRTRAALKWPSKTFELVQARLEYLLAFLKRLAFILEHINSTRSNKHVHEFLVIYSKQIQPKRHNKPVPTVSMKRKKINYCGHHLSQKYDRTAEHKKVTMSLGGNNNIVITAFLQIATIWDQ